MTHISTIAFLQELTFGEVPARDFSPSGTRVSGCKIDLFSSLKKAYLYKIAFVMLSDSVSQWQKQALSVDVALTVV